MTLDSLEIKERFFELYPEPPTPHYRRVKAEHPKFFEELMKVYGGYRSFCRRAHLEPPTPTAREQAFIDYSSRAAKRYYGNGEWSSLEIQLKPLMDEVADLLGTEYVHNYRYPSMKGGKYKFDFWFPKYSKRIEADGVFHNIKTNKDRDRQIDAWLEERGIKTLRLSSVELGNYSWKSLLTIISNYLTS